MEARNNFMLQVGIEASSVNTIEDANLFISKWIFGCQNKDEFKFLKLSLESIQRRYLEEKYSYKKNRSINKNRRRKT